MTSDVQTLQQLLQQAWTNSHFPNGIIALIKNDGFLSAETRLSLYRHSISATVINHLEGVFPVCLRLVGVQFFAALSKAYAQQYPSTDATLTHFGREFSAFLAQFPPAASLPYLTEVAALEWAWRKAFLGALACPVDHNSLTQIPERARGSLQLSLHAHSTLLQTQFPVVDIWRVNQENYVGDVKVDLNQGGDYILTWRQNEDVNIQRLSQSQYVFLEALRREQNLQLLCEYCEVHQLDAATLLPHCVRQGWLTLKKDE
jgi:hypothetical protein